jgi:hypothetical protein
MSALGAIAVIYILYRIYEVNQARAAMEYMQLMARQEALEEAAAEVELARRRAARIAAGEPAELE